MVRKFRTGSEVKRTETNPVKTTYEMLWAELASDHRSPLTIPNTMRRILEHYFKHLGQTSFDDIVEEFEGADRKVFRSLISWVHDGSHGASSDPHFTITHEQVDHYLDVFRMIFEKKNQIEHYKMMMPTQTTDDDTVHSESKIESSSAVLEEAPV